MDRSKLVIGSVGTGKTYKEVIPAINNWNGSILVLDIKKQLFNYTATDRKEKGIIIDQIDFIDQSGIQIALDMIKEGATIYLNADGDKKSITSFSQNLDILFHFILEQNISNLLIVLDEFEVLDYLVQLPLLLRTGRKKNVFVVIALPAKDEDHFIKILSSTGYNEKEIKNILNNCNLVIRTDYRL